LIFLGDSSPSLSFPLFLFLAGDVAMFLMDLMVMCWDEVMVGLMMED
jgi:hypothetical protein